MDGLLKFRFSEESGILCLVSRNKDEIKYVYERGCYGKMDY